MAKTHTKGSKVKVSWSAPASNGGATIDSYQVKVLGSKVKCTTTTTSCTLKGLDPTRRYTITIKAHNSAGWGRVEKLKKVKG